MPLPPIPRISLRQRAAAEGNKLRFRSCIRRLSGFYGLTSSVSSDFSDLPEWVAADVRGQFDNLASDEQGVSANAYSYDIERSLAYKADGDYAKAISFAMMSRDISEEVLSGYRRVGNEMSGVTDDIDERSEFVAVLYRYYGARHRVTDYGIVVYSNIEHATDKFIPQHSFNQSLAVTISKTLHLMMFLFGYPIRTGFSRLDPNAIEYAQFRFLPSAIRHAEEVAARQAQPQIDCELEQQVLVELIHEQTTVLVRRYTAVLQGEYRGNFFHSRHPYSLYEAALPKIPFSLRELVLMFSAGVLDGIPEGYKPSAYERPNVSMDALAEIYHTLLFVNTVYEHNEALSVFAKVDAFETCEDVVRILREEGHDIMFESVLAGVPISDTFA